MRGRFVELVERQLELFETEHAGLVRDCEAALDAYNAAPREEAEERYGAYLDLVDTATDALVEYRDGYARTLAGERPLSTRRRSTGWPAGASPASASSWTSAVVTNGT